MAVILPVEPDLLIWARETAGYSIEEVATRLHVPVERVASWEEGEVKPAITNLKRLASIYKRPLEVFLLPAPPEEPPNPSDFRIIGSGKPGFSPETRFAIRNARRWQEIASELVDEQGWLKDFTFPNAELDEEPESVGARIRDWLDVSTNSQLQWTDARTAFNGWRKAIENKSVLVFVLPMPRDDCRGFSLWEDNSLPAIVVNRREVNEAKAFTLLHELTHLMLRRGGVCDEIGGNGSRAIETMCNQVAAFALVPTKELSLRLDLSISPSRSVSVEQVIAMTRRWFRVSRHVAALRLEREGYLASGTYDELVLVWNQEDWRVQGGGGGAPKMKYRILSEKGTLYSTIILAAWRDGALGLIDASRMIEAKAKHLDDVAGELGL